MSLVTHARTRRTPALTLSGLALVTALSLSACGSSDSSSSAPSAASTPSASASDTPSMSPSESASATGAASASGSASASGGASATATGSGTSTGTAKATSSTAPGTYTMAQVASHNGATSCWTAIDGNVYDVTKWVSQHPGGPDRILGLCGKDGSAAFDGQHGGDSGPKARLATFKIGKLAG